MFSPHAFLPPTINGRICASPLCPKPASRMCCAQRRALALRSAAARKGFNPTCARSWFSSCNDTDSPADKNALFEAVAGTGCGAAVVDGRGKGAGAGAGAVAGTRVVAFAGGVVAAVLGTAAAATLGALVPGAAAPPGSSGPFGSPG